VFNFGFSLCFDPLTILILAFSLCRAFSYRPEGKPGRTYQSILGACVRQFFPGIVDLPGGGRDVAWTFKHYTYAEDPDDEYESMAGKVIGHLWVSLFDFSSFYNSEVALMALTYVRVCRTTSPLIQIARGNATSSLLRCARRW
jgi:hypothetical protein